ncbi:acyltransferase family protein [Fusobacterium nucleatum]|uniref:acyltransferase family protein n=1 Tax=Fusobacterium nucleatum TaxID=851 RepID=UPI0008DB2906|nr:acyltransferase family protein [Fusobacterium nucleatum]OHU81726.1 acetylase [Fusobacterium nucleatum]VTX48742.1 O-acetyltransferase OatA [Fusobacterium nucleatum]
MNEVKKRSIGIDIIKAISLISVIIYHLYEYKGTYIGVVLFFVISGYLITEVLYERDDSYFKFIKRRYIKIFPPLIAVLTLSYLAFYYFYGFINIKLIFNSLSSLFGLSNIYQIYSGMSYFERSGDLFPLLHTWSLSIEIQFYVIFPFLIYLFKKMKLNVKFIAAIIIILSLISGSIMIYKEYMNYDISAIYYGTDTRIFSILIGSAFYFLFKNKKLNPKRANILSYVFLGIIVVITLSVDYSSKSNYYGFLYLISILGGFITVTSLKTGFLDFKGPIAKPLSKLGEHSYVYYLWQYPIMIYSLEYFKWSDIDYNYTVILQIIILIILSEISYKFLIESRQGSIILRRIFLVIYVAILVFLPISTESNSEEVQNRANEIDNNLGTNNFNNTAHDNTKKEYKIDNIDYIAEKLLKEIALFKEQQDKKIEKKVDETVEKEEDKDKVDNSIEAEDYTFIGDSVMKMGEPYIKEIFKDANIDAKVSRQFTDLPKVLEALKDSKKLKNIVVIHLGTNGVINKESFESSMKLLEGKTVYLMNTVVPKPWEKSVNKSLEEWSADYSNITIIDWHKYAKGEKKLFYKDATHPKPEGAKKYAEFILESIKEKE